MPDLRTTALALLADRWRCCLPARPPPDAGSRNGLADPATARCWPVLAPSVGCSRCMNPVSCIRKSWRERRDSAGETRGDPSSGCGLSGRDGPWASEEGIWTPKAPGAKLRRRREGPSLRTGEPCGDAPCCRQLLDASSGWSPLPGGGRSSSLPPVSAWRSWACMANSACSSALALLDRFLYAAPAGTNTKSGTCEALRRGARLPLLDLVGLACVLGERLQPRKRESFAPARPAVPPAVRTPAPHSHQNLPKEHKGVEKAERHFLRGPLGNQSGVLHVLVVLGLVKHDRPHAKRRARRPAAHCKEQPPRPGQGLPVCEPPPEGGLHDGNHKMEGSGRDAAAPGKAPCCGAVSEGPVHRGGPAHDQGNHDDADKVRPQEEAAVGQGRQPRQPPGLAAATHFEALGQAGRLRRTGVPASVVPGTSPWRPASCARRQQSKASPEAAGAVAGRQPAQFEPGQSADSTRKHHRMRPAAALAGPARAGAPGGPQPPCCPRQQACSCPTCAGAIRGTGHWARARWPSSGRASLATQVETGLQATL